MKIDPNKVEHISGCRPVAREPVKASLTVPASYPPPEAKPIARLAAEARKESGDYTQFGINLAAKEETLKAEIARGSTGGMPFPARAKGELQAVQDLKRYLTPLLSGGTSPGYFAGMVKQIHAQMATAQKKALAGDAKAGGEFFALQDALKLLDP